MPDPTGTGPEGSPLQRLFPDPGPTSIAAEIEDYRPFERPHPDRPWVAANMVTSLDGRAAIKGGSTGLGGTADHEYFLKLRTRFDAVLVGAGTFRTERYGRLIPDPQARAVRERIGLPHDPLAVIISGCLDLPWDAPLFTDGGGRVLVFTREQPDPKPETATSLRLHSMPGGIDLAEVLRHLRQERGVRALLCEGGPHLLGQLVDADLLDELFLTVSPLVAGGDGPRVAEQNTATRDFEPQRILSGDGDLLTRYRRRR